MIKQKRERISCKKQDIIYTKIIRCNAMGRITFWNYIEKNKKN